MSNKKHRKTKRDKCTNEPLPDLEPIVDDFWDAYGLVWTAHQVLVEGNCGPEEGVLRLGVKAIMRACEQLDEANGQLPDTAAAHRTLLGDSAP